MRSVRTVCRKYPLALLLLSVVACDKPSHENIEKWRGTMKGPEKLLATLQEAGLDPDLRAHAAQVLVARDASDPNHSDPSLDQMVLVGHSMGGLVARMQITESWDIPWRHFASQPIESIRAPPQERARLRRLFFFEPSASVTRVVLIGTPPRFDQFEGS